MTKAQQKKICLTLAKAEMIHSEIVDFKRLLKEYIQKELRKDMER